MLCMILDKDETKPRPAFICDYCNKEITDARYTIYTWKVSRETEEMMDGKIYSLHKGICDKAMTGTDNKHRRSLFRWDWGDLIWLPRDLTYSLNLLWDEAQEKKLLITEEEEKQMQTSQEKLLEWENSIEE